MSSNGVLPLISRKRKRTLIPFLYENLDTEKLDGLSWLDRKNGIWKLPWKIHRTTKWGDPDANILYAWAVYKYAYEGGEPSRKELSTWKENFRNAIRSDSSIKEIEQRTESESSQLCKVYQFVTDNDKIASASDNCKEKATMNHVNTCSSVEKSYLEAHKHILDGNQTKPSPQEVPNLPNLEILTDDSVTGSSSTLEELNSSVTMQTPVPKGKLSDEVERSFIQLFESDENFTLVNDLTKQYLPNHEVTNFEGNQSVPSFSYDNSPSQEQIGHSCSASPEIIDIPPKNYWPLEYVAPLDQPRLLDKDRSDSDLDRSSKVTLDQVSADIMQKCSSQNQIVYMPATDSETLNSPLEPEPQQLLFDGFSSPCSDDTKPTDSISDLSSSIAEFIIEHNQPETDTHETAQQPDARYADVTHLLSSLLITHTTTLSVSIFYTSRQVHSFESKSFKLCYGADASTLVCPNTQMCGPKETLPLTFPQLQDAVSCDRKTLANIQRILAKCKAGVCVYLYNGDVYVTRHCKAQVNLKQDSRESIKLERNAPTKVFDFQRHFVPAFISSHCSTLKPTVQLTFGVKTKTSCDMVRVDITHSLAEKMLLERANQEETECSLSNEFDKRLSIEQDLRKIEQNLGKQAEFFAQTG